MNLKCQTPFFEKGKPTEREEITNELIGGNFPEQKDMSYWITRVGWMKINPYPGQLKRRVKKLSKRKKKK